MFGGGGMDRSPARHVSRLNRHTPRSTKSPPPKSPPPPGSLHVGSMGRGKSPGGEYPRRDTHRCELSIYPWMGFDGPGV
jgi:hypothetical protein